METAKLDQDTLVLAAEKIREEARRHGNFVSVEDSERFIKRITDLRNYMRDNYPTAANYYRGPRKDPTVTENFIKMTSDPVYRSLVYAILNDEVAFLAQSSYSPQSLEAAYPNHSRVWPDIDYSQANCQDAYNIVNKLSNPENTRFDGFNTRELLERISILAAECDGRQSELKAAEQTQTPQENVLLNKEKEAKDQLDVILQEIKNHLQENYNPILSGSTQDIDATLSSSLALDTHLLSLLAQTKPYLQTLHPTLDTVSKNYAQPHLSQNPVTDEGILKIFNNLISQAHSQTSPDTLIKFIAPLSHAATASGYALEATPSVIEDIALIKFSNFIKSKIPDTETLITYSSASLFSNLDRVAKKLPPPVISNGFDTEVLEAADASPSVLFDKLTIVSYMCLEASKESNPQIKESMLQALSSKICLVKTALKLQKQRENLEDKENTFDNTQEPKVDEPNVEEPNIEEETQPDPLDLNIEEPSHYTHPNMDETPTVFKSPVEVASLTSLEQKRKKEARVKRFKQARSVAAVALLAAVFEGSIGPSALIAGAGAGIGAIPTIATGAIGVVGAMPPVAVLAAAGVLTYATYRLYKNHAPQIKEFIKKIPGSLDKTAESIDRVAKMQPSQQAAWAAGKARAGAKDIVVNFPIVGEKTYGVYSKGKDTIVKAAQWLNKPRPINRESKGF